MKSRDHGESRSGNVPVDAEALPARHRLPGWTLMQSAEQWGLWRDTDGDALSFSFGEKMFAADAIQSQPRWRGFCRALAENRGGGLIEAASLQTPHGRMGKIIYKRLDPGFVFTGMLFVPRELHSCIWTVVAAERGKVGAREAAVTLQLMNEEGLSVQDYEARWAQDPYDPGYAGVDRSVLRFMSDDERFDVEHPYHPLTKVRRLLRQLPGQIEIDADVFGASLQ
jgi:hypothetical protein